MKAIGHRSIVIETRRPPCVFNPRIPSLKASLELILEDRHRVDQAARPATQLSKQAPMRKRSRLERR